MNIIQTKNTDTMNKHIILIFAMGFCLACTGAFAQNGGKKESRTTEKKSATTLQQQQPAAAETQKPTKAHLHLAKNSFDFGSIPVGKSKVIEVIFTNTGVKPLIITDTYTNCGCTSIEFPQEPFMPGKSGKFKISYDADEEGFFSKTITIYSNADNKKEIIKIQGVVTKNE